MRLYAWKALPCTHPLSSSIYRIDVLLNSKQIRLNDLFYFMNIISIVCRDWQTYNSFTGRRSLYGLESMAKGITIDVSIYWYIFNASMLTFCIRRGCEHNIILCTYDFLFCCKREAFLRQMLSKEFHVQKIQKSILFHSNWKCQISAGFLFGIHATGISIYLFFMQIDGWLSFQSTEHFFFLRRLIFLCIESACFR